MPTWDSEAYLRFVEERTQPSIDLAARIRLPSPARIVDLGCGPGNSTEVLARRWPGAVITGLDSSPDMLAAARKAHPHWTWAAGDIAAWTTDEPFDLVFSNAALQWVDDHLERLPHLFRQVAPGGAFALQVPANADAPAHRLMRELAGSPRWAHRFRTSPREWHIEPPERYYDALSPHAGRIEAWTTEYLHVVPGPDAIVEWYRGTGLRPWLQALADERDRAAFLAEYGARIAESYVRRTDGRVLFPFLRFFLIAYR